MFGNNNRPPKSPSIAMSQLSSLIAEDVEIVGDVHFSSGMRVDGRIKGHVTGRPGEARKGSLLVLSDKGRIEGSVRCQDAVVNGCIDGDLEVAHFLELQSRARVTGTIRYRQLQMDVGAVVRGQVTAMGAEDGGDHDNVVELPVEAKAAAAG